MTTTDTQVEQLVVNRLTKSQFTDATPSDTELWAVDPQFEGGKLLATDSNGDIVESNKSIDDLFYKVGDTISIDASMNVVGYISNGQTEVSLSIPTSKFLNNISTLTLNSLRVNIRTTTGNYLLSNGYTSGGFEMVTDARVTTKEIWKSSNNMITVLFNYNTALTNADNNTPLTVYLHSVDISLS